MTSPQAHNRKLKTLVLDIGGNEIQIQLSDWSLKNGTGDATITYTYVPGAEFGDDPDPDYSLELTLFADWRSAGFSTFTWEHNGEDVPFQLDHHPDIPDEHVRWEGVVHIKAADVGGKTRDTEVTQTTLKVIGEPDFSRP